jgi:hypothetical protein
MSIELAIDESAAIGIGAEDRAVHVQLVDLLERQTFGLRNAATDSTSTSD